MTRYGFLSTAAVATLALGIMGAKPAPIDTAPALSHSDILLAAGDSATGDNPDESAKMGKESGTHSGEEADTSESETKKVDQPERRDPVTEESTGNTGTPQQ